MADDETDETGVQDGKTIEARFLIQCVSLQGVHQAATLRIDIIRMHTDMGQDIFRFPLSDNSTGERLKSRLSAA